MTMRDDLRADLIREEGVILHAYQDHLGYWTIGCGRLIDKSRGGGITEAEAHYLLDNDITRVTRALNEKLPWLQHQPKIIIRACILMAFQLGVSGFLQFKQMLAAMEARDYQAAATAALESRWAKVQTPARAQRVAALIREG